jgi:hypothetical protein
VPAHDPVAVWSVQLAAPFVSFVSVLVAFLLMSHGEQIFHASINEFGLHATQILISIAIVGMRYNQRVWK